MEALLIAGVGLLALSLLLIVLEAFVPSGGIIGVVSVCCAIAGVVALFRFSAVWGVSGLLSVMVLGPMVFLWSLKMLPYTPMGKKLLGPSAGEIAEPALRREAAERESRLALLGAHGEAVTDLRPIGVIEIEGRRYDAAAEGTLVDRGSGVRVTGVDGPQLRVRGV